MKKMYRASLHDYSIEDVAVVSETAQTVVIKKHGRERRELKTTNSIYYFDSREGSKEFVLDDAMSNVKKAESALDRATELLEKASSL